jgi:hypothetical protein
VASIGKWNTPSATVSVLTTQLDGLADNAATAASTAIANQTNLDIYSDWELVLGSLSPAAGAYVAVYALLAVDGSNYPAPSAADMRLQTSQLLFTIPLSTTATTAQRIAVRNVVIPPGTFKIILDNHAGVALAANSNTLKMNPYDVNLNG